MTRGARDPFRDHDPFRLHVFVPAIMSAGLLFSIATLLRDAIAARGRSRAQHAARLDAAGTVALTLGTGPVPSLTRPRHFYALIAIASLAMSAYVVPGATLNYLRPNGYVSDIAWLLCLSLGVGLALGVIGIAGMLVVIDWPSVRPSVRWLAAGGGSGATPAGWGAGSLPTPRLGAAILGMVGMLTFVTVGVAVGRFTVFDEALARDVRALDLPWIAELAGGIGATPVSLVLATAIGAVAMRCRTFALAWVGTVGLTFGADLLLKRVVERARPAGAAFGLEDSFPSGHLAQLVLLTVVAPVALRVVTDRRRMGTLLGSTLLLGAVAGAFARVHSGMHWPTDVIGGAALGLTAGLVLRWIVLHASWHRECTRCPWSEEPVP